MCAIMHTTYIVYTREQKRWLNIILDNSKTDHFWERNLKES